MMRKRKIIGIIGLVLILVIVLFYVVRIRPMVTEYKKIAYDKLANIDEDTFAKLENTKVYGKNWKLIGEVNSGSYQYKKISEISKYVQDGYIAVEDKNFKSHHGIDYLATVRAGIKAVGVGQMEGARANGLTYWQTMRYIILPQAFKLVIPPLGNQFINLIKNSSVLAFVAGFDLMYQGDVIASASFETINTYLVVGVFYLILTLPLSYYMRYLEKKLA